MSKPLPVFTVQTFNQSALQPAGAVFAQRVESISVARSFFAGVGGAAGGRSTMMEKKMNDLTKALMEELDLQAKKMYPNAVALVDVNVHFSDIGKTDSNMFLAAQASATAIIKRVKPVGQSMMPSASPVASQPVASQPVASQPVASPVPVASQPVASPVPANSSIPPAVKAQQNSIVPVIGQGQMGGKKKKSFISKSRKNRKHK